MKFHAIRSGISTVWIIVLSLIVLYPAAPVSRYRIPWNDSAIFTFGGMQIRIHFDRIRWNLP
jgi:hypothetical protein